MIVAKTLRRAFAAALATSLLALAVLAPSAFAEFGLQPGSFIATATTPTGEDLTQAGDHPDATTDFKVNTTTEVHGNPVPDEDLKDVRVELPVGFVGNPNAIPQCTRADASETGAGCRIESQVGVVTVFTEGAPGLGQAVDKFPVYNLVPSPGSPASFGFRFFRNNVVINTHVRTGDDYGVTATIEGIPGGVLLYETKLTLWGVPADPAHDPNRYDYASFSFGHPSSSPKVAFLTNPTECAGPTSTSIEVRSWQNPDTWTAPMMAQTPPTTGCDSIKFNPSISVQPHSTLAATPTGFEVGLSFTQPESPLGLATSALRNAVVTLPSGVVVNPGSAEGLQACSVAQIALSNDAAPTCPPASEIGTVDIDTPVLAEHLKGSVYLAAQTPSQLLSIYLVAEGSGVVVKLAGKVDPDPTTGQLTTTFLNNPQLPVRNITLGFIDGPRSPLVTPSSCGTKTTNALLTPYSSPLVSAIASSFAINQGCSRASTFAPILKAGTTNSLAGSFSPFALTASKPDGNPALTGLTMNLPGGLLAKLKGNLGTQVGTATTYAGPGAAPYALPGKVFLEGSYANAPYSLKVMVPAIAGPFDLGTVVVRQKVYVDPTDAHVTVVSDPIPTILQGIPTQIQRLDVNVDRPGFIINPTSCEPKTITATLVGQSGQSAPITNHFQVADCGDLGFKPKLAISLKGGTKRSAFPQLTATLTAHNGDANIGKASVALPHSEFLAQSHIATVCTRVQFAADACPANSVYGTARAFSPLLDQPLEGPVYLRSSSNKLPDLVAALDGPIDIDLVGRIDSVKGGIRTTFANVPDAPVSKFVLSMKGGKKSLLENSRNLCETTNRATVKFTGQNGKVADSTPVVTAAACGKAKQNAHR
jgi:hypothetical protein